MMKNEAWTMALVAFYISLLLGSVSSFQTRSSDMKVSFLLQQQHHQPIVTSTYLEASKNDGTNDEDTVTPSDLFFSILLSPFKEAADIMANWDDVVDDFFYKRMGNGETFYGKRKYKPSGNVEGDYNGFGLTDKLRIEQTREYKEAWLEERSRKEGN